MQKIKLEIGNIFMVGRAMRHYWMFIMAVSCVLIAGCATQEPAPTMQLVKEPDALADLQTVAVVSAEYLRSIQQTLQEQRLKQDEEERRQAAFNATYVPRGFEINASMKTENWPDVICRRLAQLAGYDSPVVLGDRPKAPFLISINKRNVPLWELVHELGLKTGKAFVMEIHENTNLVRCVYSRPSA